VIVVGLIAGATARLVIPGKQHMSIPMTILLGIVGSFVAGLLGYVLFGHDKHDGFFQVSGLLGSIIGAIIGLLLWMAFHRQPARRPTGRSCSSRELARPTRDDLTLQASVCALSERIYR